MPPEEDNRSATFYEEHQVEVNHSLTDNGRDLAVRKGISSTSCLFC